MRKKLVAGNWKMNKTLAESEQLVLEVLSGYTKELQQRAAIMFCPPFTSLARVHSLVRDRSEVYVGAQNCHQETSGAFTGEISAAMIKACGATHVILGHSERRQYFFESDALLAAKVRAALTSQLRPIFCVGEPLHIREAGTHESYVQDQLVKGLFDLPPAQFQEVIIAYEPVWAIGTGKVASDQQAQSMHAFIRQLIRKRYGEEVAQKTLILYGGSCKPSNAAGLFAQPDVDGGLIGGASLQADEFLGIVRAC